jgi:hypothetical protein
VVEVDQVAWLTQFFSRELCDVSLVDKGFRSLGRFAVWWWWCVDVAHRHGRRRPAQFLDAVKLLDAVDLLCGQTFSGGPTTLDYLPGPASVPAAKRPPAAAQPPATVQAASRGTFTG